MGPRVSVCLLAIAAGLAFLGSRVELSSRSPAGHFAIEDELPDLPFAYTWSNTDINNSYFALEVAFSTRTYYTLEMRVDAHWNSSAAFIVYFTVMNATENGSRWQRLSSNGIGITRCQLEDEGPYTEACEPGPITHFFGGRISTSQPEGRYVILLRAFGADTARFSVNGSFNHTVETLRAEEGKTRLVTLADHREPGSPSDINGTATAQIGSPFLATFKTPGRIEGAVFTAESDTGARVRLTFVQPAQVFRENNERMVIEPTFEGAAGTWTFTAKGGEPEGRKSIPMVGLVLDPQFLRDRTRT